MSSNYNVLKELLKNCLLSAFNLAGGKRNPGGGYNFLSHSKGFMCILQETSMSFFMSQALS